MNCLLGDTVRDNSCCHMIIIQEIIVSWVTKLDNSWYHMIIIQEIMLLALWIGTNIWDEQLQNHTIIWDFTSVCLFPISSTVYRHVNIERVLRGTLTCHSAPGQWDIWAKIGTVSPKLGQWTCLRLCTLDDGWKFFISLSLCRWESVRYLFK